MGRSMVWFIVTFFCSLLVVSRAAEAQPAGKVYRLGILGGGTAAAGTWEVFRQELHTLGWVEGQNLALEYRGAEGQYERFPALAAELVRLQVDVIVAPLTAAALAATHATKTIPIVIMAVADPVGSGLVASLARPGGNLTGLSTMTPELIGKQLEFLKEVLPTVSRVAVLWNPGNPAHALMVREAEVAAQAVGVQLHLLEARGPDAFDSAFAAMTSAHAGALLVLGDTMFLQHRRRLTELAAMGHLPAMYAARGYVAAGGLIGYGVSLPDQFRRAATYVDKILKGAKPGDLPIERPMRFELVINLATAKALGITMPPSLLLLVDEVIQ